MVEDFLQPPKTITDVLASSDFISSCNAKFDELDEDASGPSSPTSLPHLGGDERSRPWTTSTRSSRRSSTLRRTASSTARVRGLLQVRLHHLLPKKGGVSDVVPLLPTAMEGAAAVAAAEGGAAVLGGHDALVVHSCEASGGRRRSSTRSSTSQRTSAPRSRRTSSSSTRRALFGGRGAVGPVGGLQPEQHPRAVVGALHDVLRVPLADVTEQRRGRSWARTPRRLWEPAGPEPDRRRRPRSSFRAKIRGGDELPVPLPRAIFQSENEDDPGARNRTRRRRRRGGGGRRGSGGGASSPCPWKTSCAWTGSASSG